MEHHYGIARAHGLARARDGLPWRHDPGPRLQAARRAGMRVIWDLNHFDPPDDAVAHARGVAAAADPSAPLWLCPVNEPALYPVLCGMPHHDAVSLAMTMARVVRDHHPDVRLLSTDPITGIGERQFAATDALVAAGLVDVVGVNYYPHTARTALRKVLVKVARRYGLPVIVAETSWHDGHPRHHGRHPGWRKGDWLHHVLAEVAAAEERGVVMAGVCWYPFVDCPPWNRPHSRHRWSHGLIRHDLSADPHLGPALRARHPAPAQLRFDMTG